MDQETTDALEMYTALVLQGATPEGDSSENALPLTIESLEDGIYAKDTGFSKLGDLVYSHSGVERYGWIVGTYENKDITTAEALLDAGVIALKAQVSPVTTIEVKAVDLSIINKDYQPVQVGEYVRVRSKVHDFDSYMLCTSIEPNLNNPEDSLYTLGMTFDSLTGIQNKRINALNATMTRNYERVEAVSVESKAAAITAGQAKEAASEAQTAAGNAQEVAGNASQAAADAADKAKEAQNKANEASDAAEDAKAAANEAQDAANDAAKTATNFIAYDESGGLQIGNKTSGSWSGFRTQITATAFNVLDSEGTVLASSGAKLIELGKNATDAVIKLCGGKGTIQAETADDGESYLTLHSDYVRMRADNTASLYSSWTNSSNMASKSALHLTHDQLNVFSEDSQNLVDGVGTWRSSSFLVCPYQIGGLADEISLMSRYGTSLHTVSGDISLFAEGGSVSINGRAYGVNRVLASTTSFMHSGQYISFSEPISSQPNGAVFVWSLYSGGAAANTDFIYCFVPKSHVINHNGSGVLMGSTSAWQHMAKYIYVRDTDCNGNDINDDTQITVDGVTIRNSAYVLRYVIGV